MSRTVILLLVLLLLQCAIAASIFWPDTIDENQLTQAPLAPFTATVVDEIRISDGFDNETLLMRDGQNWIMPDFNNLPVDIDRVDTLLQSITQRDGSWPIAQSLTARQRFQVADYHYQRRLIFLSEGESLATIYMGTSPGYRKVHARNENHDAIYSINFSNFEAPAFSGGWLDPRLLQVRVPLQIDTDFYNLYFENGAWLSRTGGSPDEEELGSLLIALKTFQVDGIANEDKQRELSTMEAQHIFQIQSLAGTELVLEFFSIEGENFVHSNEYPLFFKIGAYDFDRLTGIDFQLVSGEKNERKIRQRADAN